MVSSVSPLTPSPLGTLGAEGEEEVVMRDISPKAREVNYMAQGSVKSHFPATWDRLSCPPAQR